VSDAFALTESHFFGIVNFGTELKDRCLKIYRSCYSGYRFPPEIISYPVWAYCPSV
jgi:hypothetical protein